jgi:hypothetical protein
LCEKGGRVFAIEFAKFAKSSDGRRDIFQQSVNFNFDNNHLTFKTFKFGLDEEKEFDTSDNDDIHILFLDVYSYVLKHKPKIYYTLNL